MDRSPNLANYEGLSDVFEWDSIYADADWDAPDTINVAHEVCDRHATNRGTVALFFVGRDGHRERITFWELTQRSNQFANVLDELGLADGDRVFACMPRVPEQYVALLGTLKAGYVFGGIDEQYDADRIAYRLNDSDARVVITTPSHRPTVATALEDVESVEDVIVVSDDGTGIRREDVSYYAAMETAPLEYETAKTEGSDPALLYYTSGATGPAKGVVHGHRWIVGIAAAQLYAGDLDQHQTDLYWGTGGLGWLTAPVNTLGVWFWGHSLLVNEAGFDPDAWIELIEEFPISVMFSVPAIYRRLRDHDRRLADVDVDIYRALSTGEPLEAELVEWGENALGVPIHDTYGQAETGNMIINTYPSIETRPGSMGKPLPGVECAVVDSETGDRLEPNETGEIAVRNTFPSFFLGYWNDPDRTDDSFVDDWYLTGDLARVDEDGYFWFQGRADDVILSGGSRIGPFSIERELADHGSVREVAAVPTPHPDRNQAVKAFVVVRDSADPSDELADEIVSNATQALSNREVPESIEFRDSLPRTETGQIRRDELREDG
ncbi:acyl-CoA synthetase [Natrarchaeobius chitinivorans]|uniref:Acyl-CoA synthetase n=1 Tax=Natrarchaeobius chitinivorans TaxID=1679083 RepID=A0A3N6NE06_NATCH|nr:AMP-binding protein [Natrarchaeobius chitinivorans]RQG97082.1 acyl-CoA synthetase [Natrarchaeobius chitinivorans]